MEKEVGFLYLTVFGFSDIVALKLMYIIGFVDIIVAVSILIKPLKSIVLWAFSTAVMRPVVGQPIWDFVERGSNWMVPLSLYVILYHKK